MVFQNQKGMFKAHIPSNLEWKGEGSAVAFLPSPDWKISPDIWFSLLKRTDRIDGNFGAITMMEFSQLLYIALYLL
jgi:hypothetical protein